MAKIKINVPAVVKAFLTTTRTVMRKAGIKVHGNRKYNVIVSDKGVQLDLPLHYIYVDEGRKPNTTPPPVKAILIWIKRRKIKIPDKMTDLQLAYAISRSIGVKGIKARPFLQVLTVELGILVRDYVADVLNSHKYTK